MFLDAHSYETDTDEHTSPYEESRALRHGYREADVSGLGNFGTPQVAAATGLAMAGMLVLTVALYGLAGYGAYTIYKNRKGGK